MSHSTWRELSRRVTAPLVALAVLALLSALWAGLVRMGWQLPPLRPTLPMAHGPLMVCGFLGTLVGLERAAGLSGLDSRQRWLYIGPAFTGIGSLLLILNVGGALPVALIVLGSAVLVAAMVIILRIHVVLHSVVMLLGALAFLGGNLLWLFGRSLPEVTMWWAGFLVLTIVGERLELSRMLHLSQAKRILFGGAVAVFLAGIVVTAVAFQPGVRLASAGMLLLAAWLLLFDIARRTVRKTGLTRYIAVSLLAGYVWLAVAGLLGLRFGGVTAGFQYDAFLHSLFVGFVFSMIFAHGPIILPAITGLSLEFGRPFYGALLLLQLSLVLRVAGDLTAQSTVRQWGGLLNEVAILLFLALMARAVRRGRRQVA